MIHLPNLALAGYMGSGKTTLARHLCGRYGYSRRSFADPLKAIYEELTGRPIDKARDRQHIQALGQLGRAISPDLWASKMIEWLKEQGDDAGPFVVDDVRFPNEAAFLGMFGGFLLVHVDTPIDACRDRILERDGKFNESWLNDESERHHLEMSYDETVTGLGDVGANVDALLGRIINARLAS